VVGRKIGIARRRFALALTLSHPMGERTAGHRPTISFHYMEAGQVHVIGKKARRLM